MDERTFLNISAAECKKAYIALLDNAQEHLSSAKLLAEKKKYGHAVTLIVLSTEEMVKAVILYFDSYEMGIRKVKGAKRFFSEHKIRHFFALMFQIMTSAIRPLLAVFNKLKEELHNPEVEIELTGEIENAIFEKDQEKIKKAYSYLNDVMDWWEEADKHKQKGLYVDYKNGLITPREFVKGDYDKALFVAEMFHTDSVLMINHFEKQPEEEKIQVVKDSREKIADVFAQIINANEK